jgi:vacuolar-type H+-ATPase subunit H
MTDTDLLKKLLSAEGSGRELVREAEDAAAKRLRETLVSLENDFRSAREACVTEFSRTFSDFSAGLENEQTRKLEVFEEALRKEQIFSEDAARALRKILLLT